MSSFASKLVRTGLVAASLILAGPPALAWAAPPAEGSSSSDSDGRHRNLTSSSTYMPLPPLTATVQANYRSQQGW